jgi:DNA-binding transcriptional regulator YdaS (Cro superfamily)
MRTVTPSQRVKVAEAIGLNEQYLYQCLTGRRPTPELHCPGIEREFNGEITVEELRPDVSWQRVPDPHWPHPKGRPCIDVAAPALATEGQG